MNTKYFYYLLAGGLIVLAAWLVHAPREAHADVPEKYQGTVSKALEYLVKQQHADGHWEGEGEGDAGQHPVAMTGLVGLALVMQKNNPNTAGSRQRILNAKYEAPIRKAADWLLAQSQGQRDGLLFSGHASETTRYMEGHGLATIFLVGAVENEVGSERYNKVIEVLTRAVKYILKAQSSQGGWYHTSKVEGHDFDDPLVTVIQMQALMAAGNAGIAVPDVRLHDAQEYLKTRLGKPMKEKPDQRRLTEIAAAVAGSRNVLTYNDPSNAARDEWLKVCQAGIPRGRALQFGRDELAHYYYAQALFQQRGEIWNNYRTVMFDHLQSTQKADGSWPPASGLGIGPVYATALWCTLLQLDRQSHPSTRMEILTNL